MNGIEKIIARIESDAHAEAGSLVDKAREEAAALRADYDARAQERYWQLVREGVKEAEQRVRLLDSAARLEAKKSLLAVKQELVATAFQRARELLLTLPGEEYTALFARLAADAARTGTEELAFGARDADGTAEAVTAAANALLRERGIPGGLRVGTTTLPILGGVVLRDGETEVDCSVEALTELCRAALSTQVAEILFE